MTPTTETWLPVVGYEGFYEVSNLGRVRSLDRVVIRSDGHPRTCPGRVLVPSTSPEGRRHVSIQARGNRLTARVSVLVAEAFIGPRPEGMFCCHNNGDCADDRVVNLRWDTPSGNEHDKRLHGTNHLANKTHCPRRHPLVAPNLIPSNLRRSGTRSCLACHRARNRRRAATKNGKPFDLKSEADRLFAQLTQEASK